ncbi:MAG: nickel-dependent lactate racemase [Candidatus Latescibacteria bacterium]|nr:nickel-dependent lactate racemase [Candidatus Latescibacterota bacterium]
MASVRISVPYGHAELHGQVPEASFLGTFLPQEEEAADDEQQLLRQALEHPIGTARLRELARPGQKVAIVTSDLTRPCPSHKLLPSVLAELNAAGVPDADITVIVALGLHRAQTPAELEELLGAEVCRRVRVLNHDPEQVVRLGMTSRGTPVEFFRPLVEADLRVCLGNLEFHYFAGFSGGAKALLPGCASRATVNANHALMVQPGAVAGKLEGNPVRADLEEGAAMLGGDFILNVVVDGHHRITGAVAGHVDQAHRQGCELVAQRGSVPIPQLAEVVVVSAGGYPKDINMYQAQKALDNAMHAVRPGGVIIWVAECVEGLGGKTFESWLREAGQPDRVLEKIQREFVLGGHKAAAIAAVLKRAAVYLVSGLEEGVLAGSGLVPFVDLDEALKAALDQIGPQARVLSLPYGGSVLPVVAA